MDLENTRMEKNDPRAFFNMALAYRCGYQGLVLVPKDDLKSSELMLRAAELGSMDAFYNVGKSFERGFIVKEDLLRARQNYEIAAKGGSLEARYELGILESVGNNEESAMKHLRIAAEGGDTDSLKAIRILFDHGDVGKGDYMEILRAYKKAVDEVSSKERGECPSVYS